MLKSKSPIALALVLALASAAPAFATNAKLWIAAPSASDSIAAPSAARGVHAAVKKVDHPARAFIAHHPDAATHAESAGP